MRSAGEMMSVRRTPNFSFDHNDLASRDQALIHVDVHGLAGDLLQFDDGSLAQLQQLVDQHPAPAQLHGERQRDVEDEVEIEARPAAARLLQLVEIGIVDFRPRRPLPGLLHLVLDVVPADFALLRRAGRPRCPC